MSIVSVLYLLGLVPILLAVLHFIGDFLLQSDWMALNKSKNWKALVWHTTVYSACFLPFGLKFALITWVLHTLVDAVTSRVTSKLWFFDYSVAGNTLLDGWQITRPNGNRHWFFVVIGFDQLIHFTCLWLTFQLLP